MFAKIQGGGRSGRSGPSALKTARTIDDLVSVGAFGSSFQSVACGTGGTSTLLASGKAAMCLTAGIVPELAMTARQNI